MSNDDGSLWITFNGEIFNYLELREELIRRGHRFRNAVRHRSDAAPVSKSAEPRAVDALNGQWAFAIWDSRSAHAVPVARSSRRAPALLHAVVGRRLLFASEIKALFADPRVSRGDRSRTASTTSSRSGRRCRRGRSSRDIRELPPGHSLTWRDGSRYGRAATGSRRSTPSIATRLSDDDAASATATRRWPDATKLRLRADVPVGAYLSGGLDSSLVDRARRARATAALARAHVLDRVRRRRVRRERRTSGRSSALAHRSSRDALQRRRHRARVSRRRLACRDAAAAHRAGAAVPAGAVGPRARLQGGAHRRRRRRGLRRLRHLQGSEAAPLLVEAAVIAATRALVKRLYPYLPNAAAAAVGVSPGVLRRRPDDLAHPVLFAPAALAR